MGDNLWIWRADHALLVPDAAPQPDPRDSLPLSLRVPKAEEYYLTAMGDYPAKPLDRKSPAQRSKDWCRGAGRLRYDLRVAGWTL